MTEAQQRFLKAIAERVPRERIAEVRLFPTIRSGPIESGVAVVAVDALIPALDREVLLAVEMEPDLTPDTQPRQPPPAPASAASTQLPSRLSILTAHYRLTVKGPDRGKWGFDLVHDADAPIETVDEVVRGVVRRAGDDGEPALLSSVEFERAITEPWWSAPEPRAPR